MYDLCKGLQHISNPSDSPTAYSESKIVLLWTQIYLLLIALRQFSPNDVVFPLEATGRHALDDVFVRDDDPRFDPRVVSLLERLPYLGHGMNTQFELLPDSHPINYLDPEQAAEARDPHAMNRIDREFDEFRLRPTEVALTRAYDREEATWILDVEMNSLRVMVGYQTLEEAVSSYRPLGYAPSVPGDDMHHRNWPAFHAPTLLGRFVDSLRSLETMPSGPRAGMFSLGPIWKEMEPGLAGVRRKLLDEYGWPDAFRQDD